MGRIDGNPTPVNQEEQEVDLHDQVREEEDADYEPVTSDQHGQQDNNNYNVDQYHHQEQEKPPQKLQQQSPHHHHHPQAVPQPFPPPQQGGGFHSPQPYPPPHSPHHGQPQAFPPPPPGPHGYGQAQAQPQSFPPQAAVQYPPPASYNQYHQPPPQNNVQASPAPVPAMGVPQYQQYNEGWKTGLFGCFEDPANALVTACFPCVTFGQIAEIIDNGQTPCGTSGLLYGLIAFFIAMPCLISCTYRTKLRNQYGLIESPAPDWITHCFCEYCALCQEYRELQMRGMDPSIGWQGNMAKNQRLQHQQGAMMAPKNQTMMG